MTQNLTKRVNGTDLHQPSLGWSLQNESSARVGRSVRRSPLAVASRHGTVRTGRLPVYDEAAVTLSWLLSSPDGTQAGLEDSYHDLVALLSQPVVSYEHVVMGSPDVVTSAAAELASISEPGDFLAATHMRVSAILALRDPFLRDAATTDLVVPSGVSTLGIDSTAPIADAVIRLGPATVDDEFADVSVVDSVSGSALSWAGLTVIAGEYLYLDAGNLQAWRSTSGTDWTITVDVESRGLEYPVAGPLQLWPGGFPRSIEVTCSHPCTIRVRGAWL